MSNKFLVFIKSGFPIISDINLQLLPNLILYLQRQSEISQLLTKSIYPGTQLLHKDRWFLEVQIDDEDHVLQEGFIEDDV